MIRMATVQNRPTCEGRCVKIVASVVFCLCPPVFGMSPCPNLGQLRIEGKSFVERGESLSESLQIAIHLWLSAPAIQNDRCSNGIVPKERTSPTARVTGFHLYVKTVGDSKAARVEMARR